MKATPFLTMAMASLSVAASPVAKLRPAVVTAASAIAAAMMFLRFMVPNPVFVDWEAGPLPAAPEKPIVEQQGRPQCSEQRGEPGLSPNTGRRRRAGAALPGSGQRARVRHGEAH